MVQSTNNTIPSTSSPLVPSSPAQRKRGNTMTRISSEIRLSLPATTESHRLAGDELEKGNIHKAETRSRQNTEKEISTDISVPIITTEVTPSPQIPYNSLLVPSSSGYHPNIMLPSEDSVDNAVWSAITGRAHGTFRPLRMPSGETLPSLYRSLPEEINDKLVGVEYTSAGFDHTGKEKFTPRLFPIPSFSSSSRLSSVEQPPIV